MTEQQVPIEKLMSYTHLPRWPTVYAYLFAWVVVFHVLCMVIGREFLQLGGTFSLFVDAMVLVITMIMVRVGGGSPRETIPLFKFLGLSALFFFICSLPASLFAGIVYGILRLSLVGELP